MKLIPVLAAATLAVVVTNTTSTTASADELVYDPYSGYTTNFAESAGDSRDRRDRSDYRCERELYGEVRCDPSPSGGYYGPYDEDYAKGTGMHILR